MSQDQTTAGDLAGWDCQSEDKPHTCWFPDCSCPREVPPVQQDTALRDRASPAVRRAMARFYARRAELATDPAERERLCKEAMRHLDAAQRDQHGQPIHPLEGPMATPPGNEGQSREVKFDSRRDLCSTSDARSAMTRPAADRA